jgi:thioesterase domain-containing protein
MRARQPQGPYFLCGYSTAGSVAFEAACQLRRAGAEVEALVLIDAYCPSGALTWRYWLEFYAERLRRWRVMLATRWPGRRNDPEVTANRALQQSHVRAFRRYRPGRYDGTLTLFAARETLPLFRDAAFGWEHLAARVERHVLPGDHHAMIYEPGVVELAAEVRASLQPGGSSPAPAVDPALAVR